MGTECGEQSSTPRRLDKLRRHMGVIAHTAAFTAQATIAGSTLACMCVAQASPAAKQPAPDTKPQTGWVIEQQTPTGGKQKLYITACGIKLVHEDTHFTTIASAPKWNVMTYNDAKKLYMETTLPNYSGRYLRRLDELRFADLNVALSRRSSQPMFGVNTITFVKPPSHAARTDEVLSLSVLVLDQPPQPAEACWLLCKLYGLRNLGKVPLGIEYHNLQNKVRMRLTTQSINKRSDILISSQPPPGYGKTNNESKLMLDAAGTSDMTDMVDSLGK